MKRLRPYQPNRKIPFLFKDFSIDENNVIRLGEEEITLVEFNRLTNLDVSDKLTLKAITSQYFNWAPKYWTHLKVRKFIYSETGFENLVLALDSPVESLEYPGFYKIPYFSNYLISTCGQLLKVSNGTFIKASKANTGYYTFRMTDDSGKTQNQLRHRVLCYAFKPYEANVDDYDVNHKDGVPGSDALTNLEWTTRSGNMEHAYQNGLRSDNKEVQVRDYHSKKLFIFSSYSQAARWLEVTETTISNRAKTNGHKLYNGFQFRDHPNSSPWSDIEKTGNFMVSTNGKSKINCSCEEAARLVGLTRTSLLRALRKEDVVERNGIEVYRKNNELSPLVQ